ncbi:hypothetical protein MLD38_010012 [Melastoma candidum]|uniref:Uncharacterized protein n=1 Tax=Melastoma candidum TaxID=119954 RepID=A0ACB9R211_9MYRT|nr:hypothetical protein MLD38_010012 [Melastoma candidum]
MASTHKLTMVSSRVLVAVLVLALVLESCVAQNRLRIGVPKTPPNKSHLMECGFLYNVKSGDLCHNLIRKFNITMAAFLTINPNLDCQKLFVGQWLCVQEAKAK